MCNPHVIADQNVPMKIIQMTVQTIFCGHKTLGQIVSIDALAVCIPDNRNGTRDRKGVMLIRQIEFVQ